MTLSPPQSTSLTRQCPGRLSAAGQPVVDRSCPADKPALRVRCCRRWSGHLSGPPLADSRRPALVRTAAARSGSPIRRSIRPSQTELQYTGRSCYSFFFFGGGGGFEVQNVKIVFLIPKDSGACMISRHRIGAKISFHT